MGIRWQSGVTTGASYAAGPERIWVISSTALLQYMLADRWSVYAALRHQVRSWRLGGVRLEPQWTVSGEAVLSYLVEDAWSIDLRCDSTQRQERNRVFSNPGAFTRGSSLTVGLTYRPFGRSDAPGLGVVERLSTPAL